MTRRSMLTLPVMLLLGATYTAHAEASIDSVSDTTRRALDALAKAQTNEARAEAIRALPFGLDNPPNRFRWVNTFEFTWLNTSQPWKPFDTARFQLQGRTEIVPDAIKVLQSYLDAPQNEIRQEEKDSNVILVGTILAAIGGRKVIEDSLPIFLQTIATPDNKSGSLPSWQQLVEARSALHCLVTLCGAGNIVSDILTVSYNPNPSYRAASVRVLCVFGALLRNSINRVKGTDGKYGPIKEEATLASKFDATIPRVLEVAANDPDENVRLVALRSLHDGIYGSKMAPWAKAMPYLAKALKTSRTNIIERQSLLRIIAEIPVNPFPIFHAFRAYLIDTDELTRGYAFVGLYHILLAEPDAAVRQYRDDIISNDTDRHQTALLELETAVKIVWGYGWWRDPFPAKLNPVDDNWMSNAGMVIRSQRGQQYSRFSKKSPIIDPARKTLLKAINTRITDKHQATRLSAARVLERIGEAVDTELYSGGNLRDTELEAGLVQEALRGAGVAIARDNPSLSKRLTQLAEKVGIPHPRF